MHIRLQLLLIWAVIAGLHHADARDAKFKITKPPHTPHLHITREMALASMQRFGKALHDLREPSDMDKTFLRRKDYCDLVAYGSGWGSHELCNMTSYANHDDRHCHFMSFGISHDYSFDRAVRELAGCKGLAFDPSVRYPSTLTEGVNFFEVGANLMPGAGDDYMDGEEDMLLANVPEFAHALGLSALEVLKMDCEGCEYALASDVLGSNPSFFANVTQFATEFHFSPFWIKNDDVALELGKLLYLLEEAGLEVVEVELAHCGGKTIVEKPCNGLIEAAGLPCGANWSKSLPDNRCHNFLFAKKPEHFLGREVAAIKA